MLCCFWSCCRSAAQQECIIQHVVPKLAAISAPRVLSGSKSAGALVGDGRLEVVQDLVGLVLVVLLHLLVVVPGEGAAVDAWVSAHAREIMSPRHAPVVISSPVSLTTHEGLCRQHLLGTVPPTLNHCTQITNATSGPGRRHALQAHAQQLTERHLACCALAARQAAAAIGVCMLDMACCRVLGQTALTCQRRWRPQPACG